MRLKRKRGLNVSLGLSFFFLHTLTSIFCCLYSVCMMAGFSAQHQVLPFRTAKFLPFDRVGQLVILSSFFRLTPICLFWVSTNMECQLHSSVYFMSHSVVEIGILLLLLLLHGNIKGNYCIFDQGPICTCFVQMNGKLPKVLKLFRSMPQGGATT